MTRIEFLRRQAGLSQLELGRRLGINATAIVHMERGHRRSWPKLRQRLADYFEVAEEDLFDEHGWPLQVELKEVAGK